MTLSWAVLTNVCRFWGNSHSKRNISFAPEIDRYLHHDLYDMDVQLVCSLDAQTDQLISYCHRDSVIGLVSPKMLAQVPNGGTYFFFAGFAALAFMTACKSTAMGICECAHMTNDHSQYFSIQRQREE